MNTAELDQRRREAAAMGDDALAAHIRMCGKRRDASEYSMNLWARLGRIARQERQYRETGVPA